MDDQTTSRDLLRWKMRDDAEPRREYHSLRQSGSDHTRDGIWAKNLFVPPLYSVIMKSSQVFCLTDLT
jgi:hypothetical protein